MYTMGNAGISIAVDKLHFAGKEYSFICACLTTLACDT